MNWQEILDAHGSTTTTKKLHALQQRRENARHGELSGISGFTHILASCHVKRMIIASLYLECHVACLSMKMLHQNGYEFSLPSHSLALFMCLCFCIASVSNLSRWFYVKCNVLASRHRACILFIDDEFYVRDCGVTA